LITAAWLAATIVAAAVFFILSSSYLHLYLYSLPPDLIVAASHTYVLLSYLSNRGLARIPLDVLEVLKTTQKYVNGIALSLLHRIIDRYLLRSPLFTTVATTQTVGITWDTLLSPRPPLLNLLHVP
jgi:hypothetical protein